MVKNLTLDKMEARIIELGNQRNEIAAEMRALRAEIDARSAERTAREKVERMSDEERAALLQIVAPEGFGIKSSSGN